MGEVLTALRSSSSTMAAQQRASLPPVHCCVGMLSTTPFHAFLVTFDASPPCRQTASRGPLAVGRWARPLP